jgi:glutamate/tyrosine decarboxylase-like PLP-dependent enzyme
LVDPIGRTCRHARPFAEVLRPAGCEILNEVVLNQVLVSFGDADTTLRVIEWIQRDGTCWCGGTTWPGRVAIADQRLILGNNGRRCGAQPGRHDRSGR